MTTTNICPRLSSSVNRRAQTGFTMTELMVAIVISLLLTLIALSFFIANKNGYTANDQHTQIHETGRYALDVIARAVRQAGYEHRDGVRVSTISEAEHSGNVAGYDAMSVKKTGAGLSSISSSDVVNGSDVLAVRYFGDDHGDGNGAILSCAGLTVAAADGDPENDRGWSIFYVAKDAGGEPELRCKYKTESGWNADAIARGIESFQVLYGVDVQGHDAPDRYLHADQVDALDNTLSLYGNNAVERSVDLNRKTHWKKIRSIRVAVLVRGAQKARTDALESEYHLFGESYSESHASIDKGVHIRETSMPVATRDAIRKVFSITIQLRNAAGVTA